MEPSGVDWHLHTASLLEACLGEIGCNVRLVSLSYRSDKWVLLIILEREDDDDRESANDIFETYAWRVEDNHGSWKIFSKTEFSPCVEHSLELDLRVSTSEISLAPRSQVRHVYRRNEDGY
jgi:hypothetical protein